MWQPSRDNKSFESSSVLLWSIGIGLLGLALFGLLRPNSFRTELETHLFDTVLAIVAIAFASIQFHDAHKHTLKMEEIASSMSTRFVGDFPKDLEDIVEVAGLADRKILVMANFVDYGHYSRPDCFGRFVEKIHTALSRKVEVQFLVYDEEHAREAIEKRFPAEDFAAEKACPRFRHFFSTHYEGIAEPKTYEDFLGVLRRKRKEVMSDLLDRGAAIRLMSGQERLFFWMEDKEDAVFSFENGSQQADPLCFRTRDARLIDTFSEIFEQNWLLGQDYLKTLRMPSTGERQRQVPYPGEPPVPPRLTIPPHSFPPGAAKG